MSIDEIIDYVASLDGVLTLRPGPGDGTPEIAWGDVFFYYSPSGEVPAATQPFATIVTKNYPDDEKSDLDRPGAFRVNISASREAFVAWTGHTPRETDPESDFAATDTVLAHPVYAGAGWLAVVNPGQRTGETVRELLRDAYDRARARDERRGASRG
ncbi:DUF6194 family protein [Nocardia cyriacigeorgica]|uniref:DUF6194 family protein n=1 Tax=Nocardia cyriacigeorgica TaxID=135487 RepID=UPI002455132E|nr:DUF6194 family protein [Nocardia cyriacigeorgica]